jgi:hypothetical protein
MAVNQISILTVNLDRLIWTDWFEQNWMKEWALSGCERGYVGKAPSKGMKGHSLRGWERWSCPYFRMILINHGKFDLGLIFWGAICKVKVFKLFCVRVCCVWELIRSKTKYLLNDLPFFFQWIFKQLLFI